MSTTSTCKSLPFKCATLPALSLSSCPSSSALRGRTTPFILDRERGRERETRGKRERERYPLSAGLDEIDGGAELAQDAEAGMALGGLSDIDGGAEGAELGGRGGGGGGLRGVGRWKRETERERERA